MNTFAENLKTLPSIEDLVELELFLKGSIPEAVIRNEPGQSGSLAVYYKVAMDRDGQIDAGAAQDALELYAEHVEDARANPGKHPNIDRLFEIIEQDLSYFVKTVWKP